MLMYRIHKNDNNNVVAWNKINRININVIGIPIPPAPGDAINLASITKTLFLSHTHTLTHRTTKTIKWNFNRLTVEREQCERKRDGPMARYQSSIHIIPHRSTIKCVLQNILRQDHGRRHQIEAVFLFPLCGENSFDRLHCFGRHASVFRITFRCGSISTDAHRW